MDHMKNTLVSSITYNSLPHIEEVSRVPESQIDDLAILQALLVKHNVPTGVSIRLIHKHFNVNDGEAMIFKNATVPGGYVQLMRPVYATPDVKLHPIHYFVDDDGCLQAYEYTTDDTPTINMSGHRSFLTDFCRIVGELGLQRKFGLKIKNDADSAKINWTEYELPGKRGTIMIPEGMPSPDEDMSSYSVMTEWTPGQKGYGKCTHSERKCTHCVHCRNHCVHPPAYTGVDPVMDDSMYILGGQLIHEGTPVHDLVTAVIEAW